MTGRGEGMRLNQYIASCGICSRREADRLIEEVRVYVDGIPAIPGMRVTGQERIEVNGKLIRGRQETTVVAWYKPVGVTCTERDPHAERTIRDAFKYPIRLTYAGRLDKDSEGLLLMTDDGKLIDAMMKVWLPDLEVKTRPCRIERLGEYTFRITLTQGLNRQIRRMCRAVGHEIKFLKRVRVLNVTLGSMKPGEQRPVTGREKTELYKEAGLPLH